MKTISRLLRPYKGLPREIYIIFISRIINSIGTFVFPLLALILTQKIGFSKAEAGIFSTVLAISQLPSMLIGGKTVDKFGRKKIIIVFQFLGAVSFMICGLMKPSILMAVMIVIASDFYAFSQPALDAVSADITTTKNRKSAFSLLYMGHNLGFAIGPILGGLLYKSHLPLIFIGDAITTMLSTILFAIFIKETMNRDTQKDIIKENELEVKEEGSVIKVLLKRPVLIYFALIMFTYQFAYSQWGFLMPLQMGELFKDSGASLYGFVSGFNGLVVIVFTPLITALLRKVTSMRAIYLGGMLYAVAFGMLGGVHHVVFFFLSVFIMTIGEVMISINNSAFIANHTPESHRGRINSVLPIIIGAGYTLGPSVMGKVVSLFGYAVTWSAVAIIVFFGALCMRRLEISENEKSSGTVL